MTQQHMFPLQNCTSFIHLRLLSFFTFGFTPLHSPASPPNAAAALGFWNGRNWFRRPPYQFRISHQPSQPRGFSLILHWLNWFLLHFTGHRAILIKNKLFQYKRNTFPTLLLAAVAIVTSI
ncbi:hypothetical protein AMECASPLE_000739 [Ameca splendens]|uniref:Uncharacterized protein n=1 Tax=Ameca splendens TaxID=208324 RepID=A0ABV0ZUG2_9TELE